MNNVCRGLRCVSVFGGIVAMGLAFGGCVVTPGSEAEATGQAEARLARAEVPAVTNGRPHGTFITVPARKSTSTLSAHERLMFKTPAAPPHRIIYVNGKGATLTPGQIDDSSAQVSSIPTAASTIPPFAGTAADWSTFLACITDQYARWNVTVTDQDPGAAPHIEAIVGGSPQAIGVDQSAGGVSPMTQDCSLIETSIVFIFSDVLGGDPQLLCEVAAQEIGHSIGMDHEYLCQDPMTYLTGCGNKTFQDQTVQCGENAPRACSCSATQNSVQFMNARLGTASATPPDPTSPTIALGSPADGATVPANASLTLTASITDPDDTVASAALLWENNGQVVSADCANPPTGVTCTQATSSYSWVVQGGSGPRSWSVQATDSHGNAATSVKRTLMLDSTPPPVDAGTGYDGAVTPPSSSDGGTSGGGSLGGGGANGASGDPGAPSGGSSQSGGCSLSPGAAPPTSAFAVLGLALVGLARRRRARRA